MDEDLLRAMIDEDRCREQLTPLEMYWRGKLAEELVATPPGRPPKDSETQENVLDLEKGQTRDKVAAFLKISGRQWDKIKAVGESEVPELLSLLENPRTVEKAYRRLRRIKQANKVAEQVGEAADQFAAIDQNWGIDQITCARCEDILPQIPDEIIDAAVLDPVFGIGFAYADGEEQYSTPEEYWEWFEQVFREVYRTVKAGGLIAIWQTPKYERCAWKWFESFGETIQIYRACKWWVPTIGDQPIHRAHDNIVLFYKQGARPLRPVQPVRSYDWFASKMRFDALAKEHSCPRPLDQCEVLMESYVIDGGLVLDPFAGAATIPLATARTGRHFIAIEKVEKYCEIGRQRLALYGDPATKYEVV